MSRTFRLGLVICAFLGVCACLPVTTTAPIGSTVGTKADPSLTGMWKGRSDKSTIYFTFFPKSDGSTTVLMLAPPTSADNGDWNVFAARTAVLGAYRFIDARDVEDDGNPGDPALAHIPVLYSFNADGTLALYLMDEDAVKNAIKAGKIAGVVKPGDFGNVVITATPAALDAFLQTADGRALFTKPLVTLTRVE
jgi:hypothetical protein